MLVNEGPHGFESAVELRLGEKRTGQAQDLIGFARFPHLTFKGFDAFTLGGGYALTSTRICFMRTHSCKVWGTHPILGPMDWVFATVIEDHVHSAFAHFG